jgi:predicted nucleotidyltransferase
MSTVSSVTDTVAQVVDALRTEDVMKIILFGSASSGELREGSDIDLLVVTDTEYYPQSYDERLEYRSRIQQKVHHIARTVPIDLLIFTRPEYERITRSMSSFMRDVHENGKLVYEKPR